MRNSVKIVAAISAAFVGTAAFADHHEGDDEKDKMNAGDAPTMGLHFVMDLAMSKNSPFVLNMHHFDPAMGLVDVPGGGKGIPVHDAKDPTKIIGYVKMPAPQKPTGPVHCMIKETGLLAKSVDDCEAAGGTVSK